MQDYAIQKSSRKCFVSDRPLQPGDRFVSAIVQRGADLARRDFAHENWPGPNSETVGWWRSVVPQKRSSGQTLAPNAVLINTLENLLETPGKGAIAYLLALLLIRRRVLVDDVESSEQSTETTSTLSLRVSQDERILLVPVEPVDAARSREYQAQLMELLHGED
ncbi:MAG: hypothetical protein ACOVQM_06840 [Pirellula sp.]